MYLLVDTNPYFYNCGHYPHYEVRKAPEGFRGERFFSEASAQAVADMKNKKSKKAWHAFLNF